MSKKKKCKKNKNDECKKKKVAQESGNICGNIQLNNQVTDLDIWEAYNEKDVTVFLSVYNSPASTDSIRVRAFRTDGSFLFFNVPPGNTSSGTVDHADLINVSRVNNGSIEGRFSLDINLHSSQDS
ncbi:S-Ena type endospore appendage [Fredinandcohnia onubensis]|uniref:S-Ena type endospore appendage n=1 Tax=Fredinandcohnia onubensis TaxID=1571209 RepID=UPI000C0BDA40|nr:S-Ena type endospore appendage [Fredinandcohnia onubensis]